MSDYCEWCRELLEDCCGSYLCCYCLDDEFCDEKDYWDEE